MQKNKRLSYILIFSTIIIVVGLFLLVFNSSLLAESSKEKNYNAVGKQISSNYFEYSSDLFEKEIKEKKVVLFFAAPWCGTCTMLDKELTKDSSRLGADTIVLKINFDKEEELKSKYAVVYQHTLVQVDQDGKEITKWVGGDVETINENIRL